jgi:hypothetical protein
MLKCDDDTVLRPKELLDSGYEKYEYSGRANRFPRPNMPYTVPVGFNYWLSERCRQIIARAKLPPNNDDEKWVARTLSKHKIFLENTAKGYEIFMGVKYPESPEGPIKLYRPLKPPPLPVIGSDAFSWTIFLEANSGNTIPTERKIEAFVSTYVSMLEKP